MPLRSVVLVSIATLVVGAAVWLSLRQVEASADLTGSWTFDWAGAPGPPPIPCPTAAIKQHGPDLYINIYCPLYSTKVFSGTFDKGTGAFTVSATYLCKGFINVPWTMTGTVSPDGNSMSGTWSTLCIYPIAGTFTGDRAGPATVTFAPLATPTVTPTPTATVELHPTPPTSTPTATSQAVGGIGRDVAGPRESDGAIPLIIALTALASCGAVGGAVWCARRRA